MSDRCRVRHRHNTDVYNYLSQIYIFHLTFRDNEYIHINKVNLIKLLLFFF